MLRRVSKSPNPVWAELVQLVPVIILALPFIVRGEVELARAAPGFFAGAAVFVLVSGLVLYRKAVLNPILVGTGVWLALGALAFNVPLESLASSYVATQGFSLFVVIAVAGVVATFASPQGFIGVRTEDARWIRRTSFFLLALAVAAAAWAFGFRSDIRVGGGIPFIALNVARRVVIRRAA
jgi:hypothetical protein